MLGPLCDPERVKVLCCAVLTYHTCPGRGLKPLNGSSCLTLLFSMFILTHVYSSVRSSLWRTLMTFWTQAPSRHCPLSDPESPFSGGRGPRWACLPLGGAGCCLPAKLLCLVSENGPTTSHLAFSLSPPSCEPDHKCLCNYSEDITNLNT